MAIQDTFSGPAGFRPARKIRPTEWLVSLRSVEEVEIAAQYPVDILDLKEPQRGPLAPASTQLWLATAKIVAALGESAPKLSAALGEPDEARTVAADLPMCFDFAKAGPSGCDSAAKLMQMWDDVRDRLSASIELVAVAYADHDAANSLAAESVFKLAKQAGLSRCLVDTFTKNGQSTLDQLGLERLRWVHELASQMGLWWALAGSIRIDDVDSLGHQGIHPDCVGVRGDICADDRTSPLCPTRMSVWSDRLAKPQT
ncbi:MAG: (5-formylfuran-3-yl)methyl phosphate synthase [Rubripirellula sp.]